MPKRKPVSQETEQKFAADQALAARFDELLTEARPRRAGTARRAGGPDAPLAEHHRLAKSLDAALTAVMRAAYAAERVAIGPQGYDDRIYRRKAKATSPVRAWSAEAERLLTLRESHRLTGIPAGTAHPGHRGVGRTRARDSSRLQPDAVTTR